MANSNSQTSHEWWKDKSDPTELAAFTNSYRSSQREQHRAGWRRNVMIALLVLAVPVLIHLLTAA